MNTQNHENLLLEAAVCDEEAAEACGTVVES